MLRKIGVNKLAGNNYEFTVWAPFPRKVQLEIYGRENAVVDMERDQFGYWFTTLDDIQPGIRYRYILNDTVKRPDPASRYQPDGVHGWSAVVPNLSSYDWNDSSWKNIPLQEMIIYELHIGTFTAEGTFAAAIGKLDYLLQLGVNTIEIMPVAQYPGDRNWGYDGVYPFAVQNSYGGPEGLKQLVEACHEKGLAVVLDVVYNHLGPEGNYMADFGPIFTEKYSTPWGKAINFDDAWSNHVRNMVVQNAIMWLDEYHIDALRLDAVHAIIDNSPKHLLKELRQQVDVLEKQNRRRYYLIAESEMNDIRVINPYHLGGHGLQAQWADDFHHAVHTLATGEDKGYYSDYGKVEHLAKSFRQAFVYDGVYSSFRKKTVGNTPQYQPSCKFVVSIQNHDQIGNRMLGERLSQLVSFEMQKLAAGAMLISPFIPMLFMGEEYAEDQPFLYFVSHGDAGLIDAVRKGRAREFQSFQWQGEVPDPQSEETFLQSKLQWNFNDNKQKKIMLAYYQQLIVLRKEGAFLSLANKKIDAGVHENDKVLMIRSKETPSAPEPIFAILNFSKKDHPLFVPSNHDLWQKIIASSDEKWLGPGASHPEMIEAGAEIAIRPESLIIYKAKPQYL